MENYTKKIIDSFITDGGEMGALVRQHNWHETALGPPEGWPQPLRITLNMLLHAKFPMLLWWGSELTQFYNDAFRPMLGNPGKHPLALGQRAVDCWPEAWSVIKPTIDQVRAGGEATWHEDRPMPVFRNGRLEEVYSTSSYSAVTDEAGQVVGVLVVCQETTHKVLSLSKLALQDQSMRTLFHQAPVAIALLRGPDHIIELANERVLEFWGRTAGQVMDRPVFDALPEARGQGFEDLLATILQTGESYAANETHVTLLRKGQLETVYFSFVYHGLREPDGAVSRVLVVANEITRQVTERQDLEERQERFHTLLEASATMTWTNTPNGKIDFYNQRWYEYTGLPLAFDNDEWAWLTMIHPDDQARTRELYEKSLRSGEVFLVETRYRRADGQYRWHLNRSLPLRDETGLITGWVGTSTDIHEQKTLEAALEQQVAQRTQQLLEANRNLQRSNEGLEQFAYVASHDLQEPLRKIQQFGALLKTSYASQLDANGVDIVVRMQSAAIRMSGLIRDLLDYSRLTISAPTMTTQALKPIIDEVLAMVDETVRQQGAIIEVSELGTVPGNASQLTQLFQNLLTNALKFTHPNRPPRIEIHSRAIARADLPPQCLPEGPHPEFCLVEVRDNGIGFDQEQAERIFGTFQRLHGKDKYPGTGIGLAVVKKVAENHQGCVFAEGHVNEGATFMVYLPTGKA